jgi:hypothetical protein
MSRTNILSWTVFRVVLVACTAALGIAGNAAAQAAASAASDSGVVVNIRSESVSPGLDKQSPGAAFFEALAKAAIAVAEQAGVKPTNAEAAIQNELGSALDPETTVSDYVVSVKGNRMRVDMGGSSLLAGLTPDGSVAEWAVLDPASGRLIASDMFDAAVRDGEAGYNPYGLVQGEVEILDGTVTRSGGTREIQGFTAYRHDYGYGVHLFPVGKEEGVPFLAVRTVGEAWIAEDGPDVDPDVATVFRAWAHSFGNQGNGAKLAERGLLLGASETKTVAMGLAGSDSPGAPVLRGSTSFDVTGISRQPLDDARFSGFERAEKQCDCSCDAFKELQAIGEMSREEQEAHPKAMTLAMCAPRCTMTWMQCPKKK